MSKILTTVTVAALLLVFNLGEAALAQFKGTASGGSNHSGKCAVGTCATGGGELARDVKYCSAANCKKPQGSASKSK
jgi:hypothetical protein